MQNNKIKCISFDFDNTLAYVSPKTHILIPRLLRMKGYMISTEEFKESCITIRNNMPDHLAKKVIRFGSLPLEERQQFIKDYNYYRIDNLQLEGDKEDIERIKKWLVNQLNIRQRKVLYNDVKDVITELKNRHLKLYVISGNHSDGIIELLANDNLLIYFDDIISVDKFSIKKIDNYQVLLEKSKLRPDEIIHIGDDPHTDGIAPQKHGIKSIIIKRRGALRSALISSDIYPTITKLTGIFHYI
ncbi:MAG: HAD family hydrolase [Asgard group archaeon]|nr:HAD family hydrolase [Asgard group archaeon]